MSPTIDVVRTAPRGVGDCVVRGYALGRLTAETPPTVTVRTRGVTAVVGGGNAVGGFRNARGEDAERPSGLTER